ncbi:ABC transporter permease [Nocardia brasiliensis]|uniref:Putative peptide ABC transporter permease n=1 Tax=Nocardia brasiliensis (strain ATCC 700358 / HUJEG-1) TaxID=1133849 RepID=K0EZE5_NOCB7|nr:ABC transporter permease [Nocardia brasiliensis]AFU05323.1 putative peptide ABC transporter permease [Nocardia brasiliensis ATCC 700358]OCF87967.1 ABC transporter permease [Nocardia brasiliensis]
MAFARLFLRRIVLLIALLATVFVVVDLLPGSTARAVLGRDATPELVAAKEHELGLDRPLPVRFWDWIAGVATGDFGHTARGRSINELLAAKFPPTLLLGGLALVATVIVSLLLGAWWATRQSAALNPVRADVIGSAAGSGAATDTSGRPGRAGPDHFSGGLIGRCAVLLRHCAELVRRAFARALQPATTTAAAIPEFVLATLLILIFALALGWLPAVTVTGRSGLPVRADMLVLPVLALAIPQIGWNTRVVRAALVDAARAPHVEGAVLDGIGTRAVLLRHVLPFALPTIVASFATTVGMVLGGALVVETLFNYPGLGAVLAGSVADRDVSTVAAVVALSGVVIMCVLAVADGIRAWSLRGSR